MKTSWSVRRAEEFGRVRLSKAFFMRDFLCSEIAATHGMVSCASNQRNLARHIWDRRDHLGMGAVTSVVIPWLVDRLQEPAGPCLAQTGPRASVSLRALG